jgi:tetratricopeptide (TPR) repeat protein
MGEAFRDAFLLSHEGAATEALTCFDTVPEEERNDLFYFERGALLARLGRAEEGRRDLEAALGANPLNLLAFETLVNLDLTEGRDEEAEERILGFLNQGIAPGFCHGRLAVVCARRNDPEKALEHGLEGVKAGGVEIETVILTASILEGMERMSEAEQLLSDLPAGGCGGGAHTALAEFWLRRNKNLDQALEVFKEALRLAPEEPRWPVRIAQTYLGQGWKNEAYALAEKVLTDPRLAPDLREEARAVLVSKEAH